MSSIPRNEGLRRGEKKSDSKGVVRGRQGKKTDPDRCAGFQLKRKALIGGG